MRPGRRQNLNNENGRTKASTTKANPSSRTIMRANIFRCDEFVTSNRCARVDLRSSLTSIGPEKTVSPASRTGTKPRGFPTSTQLRAYQYHQPDTATPEINAAAAGSTAA